MIQDVIISPLKQIGDERGKVMHMLRSDSPLFESFGEIYFSIVNPGIIKGWTLHTSMIVNMAAIRGNIKIVLFDDRQGSKTRGEIQEIEIGENNYCLVKIPPGIWTSFKGISSHESMIANCASCLHDPKESRKKDLSDSEIPYRWK